MSGDRGPDGARSVAGVAREHFRAVSELIESVDLRALEAVVDVIRGARDRAAAVYVMGNGGSASTASHFANDLAKATKRPGVAPIRVASLTDNASWITALANDHGYESVFVGQLESCLAPGDVVIVISASGNSPNLVRAIEFANERGATTVALAGFDGGAVRKLATYSLFLPSEPGRYGPVEDVHLMIQHVIASCVAR